MYWLNIDKPTRKHVVHVPTCVYCKPISTKWKSVQSMGRDGGWFSFDTLNSLRTFYKDNEIKGRIKGELCYCKKCITT
jgi:hypothetical protein